MLSPKDDTQKSFILRILTDIKLNLFKVIYLIMKNDEQPRLMVAIVSIIQLFQILYFNFSGKLRYLWDNNAIADGIYLFLKYFTIAIHLVDQNFNTALIIFYFCFGLIILAILLMILIALTVQNKNAMSLPQIVLRILLKMFLTIGFMPFMGLFFFILTCETNSEGISVMHYIPQQECWVSSYTVHAIFAIFAILLFQALTSLIALLYYESKNSIGDANSQRNGRPYAYYHFFITASTMSYILLEVPRFTSVILSIVLAGSFVLFFKIHKEQPFYNIVTQKIWSIITAVNFWTILLLVFAALLEGSFFTDTIVGWLVGTPLIILIIIRQPENEVDLLAANINQATSGEQLIKLCEYMLRLIDISGTDQNASLMLDGFIEIHKQTCPKPDCVLKVKKQLSEKFKNNPIYRDRNQTLIEIINQIYFYGIKAFPQDVSLRLNYAFFLIDRMKLKQQALAELQQAEQSGPGFDHEFIIYRYKRIIEDDLQEQQQENINQVDIVTEIAFQNQSKQLAVTVEKTALVHLDFWTQLQEDNPDIGRLNELGFKIMQMVGSVEEQWQRLRRLNQKAMKLNRLMGKYFIQILNDDEQGLKLLQQVHKNQEKTFRIDNLDEIANESLPTIVILTEIEKIGIIQNVNKAACSMIGYTKTDLLNRKVNVIQPEIFAKFHDHFIEQYLEKTQEQQFNGARDRLIFVKTKSNYIIPCYFSVRMMQTFNQGLYLCASFRQELHHRASCYMICELNGIIENISSSCIKLLGVDLRQIQLKPINIQDLFPDFMDRKEEFMNKGGAQIFFNPANRTQVQASVFDFDQEHVPVDSCNLQCFITEIYFTSLQIENLANKVFGYIIKFEKVYQFDISQLDIKKKNTNPYQFKFNFNKHQFQLEMNNSIESVQDYKIDQSVIWEDTSKITQINEPQIMMMEQFKQQEQIINNYGDGIKTVRLWMERIVEIEDPKSDEDEEMDESMQRSVFQESNQIEENEEEQDNNNLFKSKQALAVIFKQSKLPKIINTFKISINLVLLLLIVCAYLSFFFGINNVDKLSSSLPLLSKSNTRLASFLLIQSVFQDYQLLNLKYLPAYIDSNNLLYNSSNEILQNELQLVTELQTSLTLADISLNSKYSDLQNIFESSSVQMKSYDGSTQNYTYNEALQQLIAKALSLNNSQISEFTLTNSDLYYFQYNCYNGLIENYLVAQQYYYYNIISQTEIIEIMIKAFLATGSVILFFLMVVLALFMVQINFLSQTVLTLFLDLNEKSIKQIYHKCENFITNLQVGEEEEMNSDQDEKEEDNDPDVPLVARRKRRKHKNTSLSSRNQFIGLIFFIIVIEAYFVAMFLTTESTIEQVFRLTPVLNLTSFVETYYRYGDNTMRQYFFDPSYQFNGMTGNQLLTSIINQLYTLDASIHQINSYNVDILEQSYQDAFNLIFILNPCDILQSEDKYFTDCITWQNGVMEQGLSIAMTQYFESLKYLLSNYQAYNESYDYQLAYQISDDKRLNYAMNLINLPQGLSARRMSKSFIRISYQYLITQLELSIQNKFDNIQTQSVATFVSFNVFVFVLYFIVWIPLFYKICHDTLRTRMLLIMIPLNMILRQQMYILNYRIKSIKQFIRKIINH